MYVKPAPGVLLRDPVTKQLLSDVVVENVKTVVVPQEGMLVGDHDFYWIRRLRDKDAVRASGPASPSGSPPTTSNSAPSTHPAAVAEASATDAKATGAE